MARRRRAGQVLGTPEGRDDRQPWFSATPAIGRFETTGLIVPVLA